MAASAITGRYAPINLLINPLIRKDIPADHQSPEQLLNDRFLLVDSLRYSRRGSGRTSEPLTRTPGGRSRGPVSASSRDTSMSSLLATSARSSVDSGMCDLGTVSVIPRNKRRSSTNDLASLDAAGECILLRQSPGRLITVIRMTIHVIRITANSTEKRFSCRSSCEFSLHSEVIPPRIRVRTLPDFGVHCSCPNPSLNLLIELQRL